MGFKDFFKKLVPKIGKEPEKEMTHEEEKQQARKGEVCALCNATNPDKKWMGQMWHTDCFRRARKMAKKMI